MLVKINSWFWCSAASRELIQFAAPKDPAYGLVVVYIVSSGLNKKTGDVLCFVPVTARASHSSTVKISQGILHYKLVCS